jgi:cysteinyl-tRNA synthetase
MSKSAGGFLTLQSLVDAGYDPLDYRYFLLGGHYRSQLQFSWEGLTGAKNARKSLADKVRALADKAGGPAQEPVGAEKYLDAFNTAIEDDLSTPRALAELWGLLRDNALEPAAALAAVFDMDRILGIGLENAHKESNPVADEALTQEIEGLIAERAAAKKNKDFATADSIRQGLKERGIALDDGPGGTAWRYF